MQFRVTVDGSVKIKDDSTFGRDHYGTLQVDGCQHLSPGECKPLTKVSKCVGGEVRVDIELTVRAFDDCVRITGKGQLFEGDDCNGRCRDEEMYNVFVSPDESKDLKVHLRYEPRGRKDKGDGTMVVKVACI